VKFTQKYPNINTISLGPDSMKPPDAVVKELTSLNQLEVKVLLFKHLAIPFKDGKFTQTLR
jgi:hypothetical protein